MSSREPFFEPPLPLVDEGETQRHFANHPWSPPINVVPVSVPVEMDVVTTESVVVRLTDLLAYDRGVVVGLETWLHTDSATPALGMYGLREEPRVGLLLGDGTKLGAGDSGHSPDVDPPESGTPDRPGFVLSGGSSGELRVSQTFWVHPIPEGDAELVVSWDRLDVPETFVPLDLAAARDASTRARELWPLPDVTESEMGWFAYAPGGHTAYTPSLDLTMDGDRDSGRDSAPPE